MTSRYETMFERLRADGAIAFGAFLMLGDPDPETSFRLLDAAVEGGADMIEVGIPFSDPVADGPVIQAAAGRALRCGVGVSDCFDLLRRLRDRHREVPFGILTYANIVAARGIAQFCSDCAAAGTDSLLIADVPTIEAEPYAAAAGKAGIDLVLIAASNCSATALATIARLGSGYTYCVARSGVTGERDRLDLDHDALFAALRTESAAPPVLGFGISTPDHVRQARASGASGVISGSAIVRLIETEADPVAAVRAFVGRMKAATAD